MSKTQASAQHGISTLMSLCASDIRRLYYTFFCYHFQSVFWLTSLYTSHKFPAKSIQK